MASVGAANRLTRSSDGCSALDAACVGMRLARTMQPVRVGGTPKKHTTVAWQRVRASHGHAPA
jgi:hypothetical protein